MAPRPTELGPPTRPQTPNARRAPAEPWHASISPWRSSILPVELPEVNACNDMLVVLTATTPTGMVGSLWR